MFEETLKEKLDTKLMNLKEKVRKPNILITGITGTGKSSLVNTVFGMQIAETGAGEPVTEMLRKYTEPDIPIVLYDTVGYEVDTDIDPLSKEETFKFISGHGKGRAENRIHLAWYVIDASSHRIQSIDIDMCNRLRKENIPFAIVFSKCDLVTERELKTLKDTVKKHIKAKIFSISNIHISKMGHLELENLCEWSCEQLPDILKFAFIKAQRMNLKLKRIKALSLVSAAIAGNFAVGFSPIPFSDSFILLPVQGAMIAGIIYLYETPEMGKLKSIFASSVTTLVGTSTAGNILKCFPGIGTIAGGVINGSVAAVITTAIGIATTTICHKYYNAALNDEQSLNLNNLEAISEEFKSTVSNIKNSIKKTNYKKALKNAERE